MSGQRLNSVYPKIGDNATTPTRVDFGTINSGALTTPTMTTTQAAAVLSGVGFLKITISGNNRNLMTLIDG